MGRRGGRRTTDANEPYLLPRVPTEIDRLDLQHYALRELLGANYLAPVRFPRRVLDAGAGTGQWGWDLCEQFPEVQVIGLDLVPGKPDGPAGYHCVRGNVLEGLPFADASFDFVHQRFIFAGVPVASWRSVVADVVRVTRPGGWVELAEPDLRYEPEGPAGAQIAALYCRAAQARGLDSTGLVFRSLDERLHRTGLVEVKRREVGLPIGAWGGRVGSLLATDFRNSAQSFLNALQQQGGITAQESNDLAIQLQREFEELQVRLWIAIAWGRKPSGPGETSGR
jgi:SAM-dependent methyltransferase